MLALGYVNCAEKAHSLFVIFINAQLFLLQFGICGHCLIQGLIGIIEISCIGIDIVKFCLYILKVFVDVCYRTIIGEVYIIKALLRSVDLPFGKHSIDFVCFEFSNFLFQISTCSSGLSLKFLHLIF